MCHHIRIFLLEKYSEIYSTTICVFDDLSNVMDLARDESLLSPLYNYYIYEAIINDTQQTPSPICFYRNGEITLL